MANYCKGKPNRSYTDGLLFRKVGECPAELVKVQPATHVDELVLRSRRPDICMRSWMIWTQCVIDYEVE